MHRRRFLAAGTTGLFAATAGCNSLGQPTRLPPPEEAVDADGREKHLLFHDGDQRVAVITLAQRVERETSTEAVDLRLYLAHGGTEISTRVERFQFDLRTPTTADQLPAEIYLNVPRSGLADRIDLDQVGGRWTRIAAADPGQFGGNTIILDTLVSPVSGSLETIEVRARAELTTSGTAGTRYQLAADTRFSPPTRS